MGEGPLTGGEEYEFEDVCQIFFPSLGSRLPLIVTLSPKLWYLPFQNPNSPRRSKSLKHKNGK